DGSEFRPGSGLERDADTVGRFDDSDRACACQKRVRLDGRAAEDARRERRSERRVRTGAGVRERGRIVTSATEAPTKPAKRVEHFTLAERAARGRAARAETPRSGHVLLDIATDRDPVGTLDEVRELREPDLLPIRYGRMMTSPF